MGNWWIGSKWLYHGKKGARRRGKAKKGFQEETWCQSSLGGAQ